VPAHSPTKLSVPFRNMKNIPSPFNTKGVTVEQGTVAIDSNAPLHKDKNLETFMATEKGEKALLTVLNTQGALYRVLRTDETIIMPIQTETERLILDVMLRIAPITREIRKGLREMGHLAA
jgi:hypothetical protein